MGKIRLSSLRDRWPRVPDREDDRRRACRGSRLPTRPAPGSTPSNDSTTHLGFARFSLLSRDSLPKKWQVTFEMSRTIEVEAKDAIEAEDKARESVLFTDVNPIDREDIDEIHVGWVNPEPAADSSVVHQPGCWGRHCHHYDCDTSDCAIDFVSYCSQCDIEAH